MGLETKECVWGWGMKGAEGDGRVQWSCYGSKGQERREQARRKRRALAGEIRSRDRAGVGSRDTQSESREGSAITCAEH
eukprot:3909678-Rhodomonas_salina.1